MLPILILFGIPLAISVILFVVFNWNELQGIWNIIESIGQGSLLIGILVILFSIVGVINAATAFLLWTKAFLEMVNRKANSVLGFWLPIILAFSGWIALFLLIRLL